MNPDEADGIATQLNNLRQLLDWIIAEQPDQWQPLLVRVKQSLAVDKFDDARDDLNRLRSFESSQQFRSELLSAAGTSLPLSAFPRPSGADRMTHSANVWEIFADVFPEDTTIVYNAAVRRAQAADWEPAAKWLRRVADADPEQHLPQYRLAPLLLKLDRLDEYQELCQGMLGRFDESAEPLQQSRAVQACLWHPSAVENPQRLVDQMQAVFDSAPSSLYYRQTALGLAHLRNGSATDAINWLEQALDPDSGIVPTCEVRALAALAMAHQQSGDQSKAEETIQRALERYDAEAPRRASTT